MQKQLGSYVKLYDARDLLLQSASDAASSPGPGGVMVGLAEGLSVGSALGVGLAVGPVDGLVVGLADGGEDGLAEVGEATAGGVLTPEPGRAASSVPQPIASTATPDNTTPKTLDRRMTAPFQSAIGRPQPRIGSVILGRSPPERALC